MTPDPRVAAVEAELKQYTRPTTVIGMIGWGSTVEAILAVADAVDPVRGEVRLHRQQRAAIEALFSGGPDTECRTVWDDGLECVSVPRASLVAALGGVK